MTYMNNMSIIKSELHLKKAQLEISIKTLQEHIENNEVTGKHRDLINKQIVQETGLKQIISDRIEVIENAYGKS